MLLDDTIYQAFLRPKASYISCKEYMFPTEQNVAFSHEGEEKNLNEVISQKQPCLKKPVTDIHNLSMRGNCCHQGSGGHLLLCQGSLPTIAPSFPLARDT